MNVRATGGDVYSAGAMYARGSINTEGRLSIGNSTTDFHYISKHGTDGLQLGYNGAGGAKTGLRIRENGSVALGRNGSSGGDLINKKYVDDKVASFTTRQNENTGGSAPYFGCRAWAHYNGVTRVLAQNGNISKVQRMGVGHYRFFFDVDMHTQYYSVNASVSQEAVSGKGHTVPFIFNQQKTNFDVVVYDEDQINTKVDKSIVNISVFA